MVICFLYFVLFFRSSPHQNVCTERLARNCTVNLSTFPFHLKLKVWVSVSNALGSVESDELLGEASSFGMTADIASWIVFETSTISLKIFCCNYCHFYSFVASIAKPNPPEVQVLADVLCSTVMVEWKHLIPEYSMRLRYVIRYCQAGSSVWTEVWEHESVQIWL